MATDHQLFDEMPVVLSKYSRRVLLKTILDRNDHGLGLVNQRVVVGGWVKSSREMRKDPPPTIKASEDGSKQDAVEAKDPSCVEVFQSRIPFIRTIMKVLGGHTTHVKDKLESDIPKPPHPSISILQISDGSCVVSLQILVDSSIAPPSQLMPTGTCVLVDGVLQKPSIQGKHVIEVNAEKVLHIGVIDQDKYPLSKKSLPLARLRDCAHFRPRTTTVASVMRIRSALNQASHTFFQSQGFLHVEAPIITATDAEGFTEKFQVCSFEGKDSKRQKPVSFDDTENVNLESVRVSIAEKIKKVEELRRSDSNKEALAAAVQDLRKTTDLAAQLEAKKKSNVKPKDFKKPESFFSNEAFLTVSGRPHLESFACALGNVYTLGPRFEADKSESRKSLAEMWMIEAEMAFSELQDAMNCAEDFLKFVSNWVSENCFEYLYFLAKRVDKAVLDRLQSMASISFEKISYATAVDVLNKVTDISFETKIKPGMALTEEHESYLVDELYKKPVIIYDHPKEIKPFYMRLNDDGKTVAAFDVIVPKVGAIIRGSQNEERLNLLSKRIKDLGLRKEQYEWYLDLRKQGTVKHSGFSVVFDVMVLFATGLNDVRDAVPFPRDHGKLNN